MKRLKRRSFLALALGSTAGVAIGVGPATQTAAAARQHKFLHGVSSEVTNILVKYNWNGTGGYDYVPRGTYAQIDVGSVFVPKGYSLWLDTRPGTGTTWTRWAGRSTKSRYVSMKSMPVTSSHFVLRYGDKWNAG